MIQLNLRLVPEYPDLVDESHELLALVEEKQKMIEDGQMRENEVKKDCYSLAMQCDEKDGMIKNLQQENDALNKKIKQ